MGKLLFVYGDLKRGEENHKYLKDSKYLGRGFLEEYEVYGLPWGRATVVPVDEEDGFSSGDEMVIGELYEVSEEVEKDIEGFLGIDRSEFLRSGFNFSNMCRREGVAYRYVTEKEDEEEVEKVKVFFYEFTDDLPLDDIVHMKDGEWTYKKALEKFKEVRSWRGEN